MALFGRRKTDKELHEELEFLEARQRARKEQDEQIKKRRDLEDQIAAKKMQLGIGFPAKAYQASQGLKRTGKVISKGARYTGQFGGSVVKQLGQLAPQQRRPIPPQFKKGKKKHKKRYSNYPRQRFNNDPFGTGFGVPFGGL